MKNDNQQLTEQTSQPPKSQTTLKFGRFQLNTSNFWISIVCILCMFLITQLSINIYMYNKMFSTFLKHETNIVELICKIQNTKQL